MTARQVRVINGIVRWYLASYHGTASDLGLLPMFTDRERVGAFAVSREELGRDDGDALFRMLVATTMFQRRQDVQILRILRSLSSAEVAHLTQPKRLLRLVDQTPCEHLRSTTALHDDCDLAKHKKTKKGRCSRNPAVPCHLKTHTVLMRRYGHFGKVPTSAALMLREAGATSISELRGQIFAATTDPLERAKRLEGALSRAWRVSFKIASMFLSALSAPDLSSVPVPWTQAMDWQHFVVVDTNVDAFLKAIGYRGSSSYDARRAFIRRASERINLRSLRKGLRPVNARLVQQAMYVFMSATNRRANADDCMHSGAATCEACPVDVRKLCPVRS